MGPPVQTIPMASRHLHGLFLAGIELHAEKVAIRIFTSRPTQLSDLKARLRLLDDRGTDYVMQTDAPAVIDGKAIIEFTPGLPPTAGSLAIDEPGVRSVIYAPEGSTIRAATRS